jgi:endonuclease YncB( thermonuclease family)
VARHARFGGGADGEDLNAWLVTQGWALAYRRYSRDYADEQDAAQAARRGVWQGQFMAPWSWRKAQR